jgi:hypothetical protein
VANFLQFSSTISQPVSDSSRLTLIIKELEEMIKREDKRPMGHEQLSYNCYDLINDFIAAIDADLNYDPTDDMGGEPPMTMQEMHSAAWKEHLEAHS